MHTPEAQPTKVFPLCADQCALLEEVNHRTANQFTILTSYIHLSLEELRRHPSEIRDLQLALAAIEARARALASLNRRLMDRRRSGPPTDVSLMLHDVCATFSESDPDHCVVDAIAGSHLVEPSVNIAVGQIVTEAVMNALKYAYPEGQTGEIIVRSAPAESGVLLIEVVDRGMGALPATYGAAQKGFGVRLMRGLAVQENIGLSFVDASPGLCVQFAVPLAHPPDSEPARAMGRLVADRGVVAIVS